MGQGEVFQLLEESKKPLSRSQIAEKLEIDAEKVSKILNRMLKCGDIKCIELDRFEAQKLIGWQFPSRRARFYYI